MTLRDKQGVLKMNRKELGNLGEKAAAKLLELKGYRILFKNFRCRHGEIDIIAEKDNVISFVEVKTRQSLKFGRPCEAVNSDKQNTIKKIVRYFSAKKENADKNYSIDVIEVYFNHMENVVQE